MATAVPNTRKKLLTGLFAESDTADHAYQVCVDRGYDVGDINVVVSEGTRKKLLAAKEQTKSKLADRKTEGGELGGPSGGRVGLLVTIFAAVGAAVAIPAIGFAAGPIVVALTAAGAAGVAGGLIAALGNWGIPDKRTREYEAAIKKGEILMMVEPRSEADRRAIEAAWRKLGGRDVQYG